MFGGGSAFGSSAFGQQPQQPQQQQAPLFGQQPQQQQQSAFGAAFGSAANTASGFNARPSAFGSSAFGSTATQQPASSGFGFGTSTATPAFGAAANSATSGGLFGSRPATTSAFGSTAPTTGGVFGSTPAANTGFGASSSTPFGATATGQVQGTVNPEYTATVERDASTGVNNHYQTITAMPAYRNYSVEELRVQDYQAGRKNAGNAAATGGAFGSTGGFGAQTSTPFGQSATTSAFGAQPSTSTAGSAFGQTTGGFGQSAGSFGQSATTGGFGSASTGTTGGLFGQQPASTASAFGSTPAATSGFGGSAFGQPQQQQTTGFGSTPAAGGFGASAAAKPFSFGQTPATSQPATGFGATGTTGFGQQPQQQQQSVGGLFGQAAQSTPSFGQPQSTGASFGFGAKPASTQPATGFGGFGASTANKPTTGFNFGASTAATPSATATSGFGGFGGATGTAGTSGFGSAGGASGGLFGASKPAASTGLFGNTQQGATAGGFGGFGAANPTGTAGAGGLFGAKPATTGLSAPLSFGATGQAGGLFGGQQNINTTGSFNLPATGGLTTFGTTGLQQQPNANQPPLYASLDKYPYGYNPLFENLPAGGGTAERSSSVAVSEEPSKKLSTTPHFLLTPRAATRIKLRGYSFTPAGEAVTRKTSGLDGISDEAVLRPEAFAPRPSIKRLIVNKKVSPNDISNAVNGDNGVLSSGKKSKALFDPHLEMIATQHGVPGTAEHSDRPSQAAESTKNVNRNTAFSDEAMSQGYYIKPSLQTLGNMSIQDLKKVQNLVVGLKGVGEITFDGPVDLSEIDLDQIMVGIVNFQLKTCTVYPDENAKPPRGKGLNVPATIKLEKCYPCDKTTKQPITDPQHPRVIAIIRKLREVPETEFIDFEASTGTWTFKVHHF
ncbi:hypothetical protein VKS41_001157 [Umbelopsis sp. WA50703]